MLSGILPAPFSPSPAVSSPYDKINGPIQNSERHKYAGQKLFLILN